MKHYGLIKASRTDGSGRVNRVVEIDLPPTATWPDLQQALDAYCAEREWSFIAFHPYGAVTGRHRFEAQEARQDVGSVADGGSSRRCTGEAKIPGGGSCITGCAAGVEDAQPWRDD